jgi:hypothetical protein
LHRHPVDTPGLGTADQGNRGPILRLNPQQRGDDVFAPSGRATELCWPLTLDERAIMLAALEDPPEELTELRALLLNEHEWRQREGLDP